jgi:hypothetical protein
MRVSFLGTAKRLDDRGEDAVEITKHVVVPESNYAKALTAQVSRSRGVSFGSVLPAVGFDDQSAFQAAEIRDIRANRPLPTEFGPIQAPPP